MRILCMIIIVLCIGCANTDNIKDNVDNNVVETEEQDEDKNVIKSIIFYFWVITGGM